MAQLAGCVLLRSRLVSSSSACFTSLEWMNVTVCARLSKMSALVHKQSSMASGGPDLPCARSGGRKGICSAPALHAH